MVHNPRSSRERWDQIESILDQVLELDNAKAIEVALVDLCGEDFELRAEIESLIAASGDENDLLECSINEAVPEVLSAVELSLVEGAEPSAGQALGAYRLQEVIGRGGMGVVYLAERDDEQFDKQVAVKVMSAGLGSSEVERRFLIERQILADLEHPGIGRLLDGGVTEEGHPYLVMEYVDGEPIDEYCRVHGLGLEERLDLFLQVCEAVQFAHQNMVVHRDLKPSNILVTSTGTAKLLDFGIAKMLDPGDIEAGNRTLEDRTTYQPRTLEYASPEQVTNCPVSAASDVYSLGVVLFRILTDRPPYRLEGLGAGDAERVICEQTPESPSSAALHPADDKDAAASGSVPWSAKMKGDLDNIVLKALRKDPASRYLTFDQLSEDLRRYLDGLPVAARPRSWGDVTRKFVVRHQVGVASALFVLLAILIGSGVSWWQAKRASDEAVRSQRVVEVLSSLFEDVDPFSGEARAMSLEDLLDRGVDKVQSELAEDPEMRLRLTGMLGRAFLGQGNFDRAEALHQDSLAVATAMSGSESVEAAAAMFNLGQALQAKGDFEGAETNYRKALAIFRNELGDATSEVADSLQFLGILAAKNGDWEAAETLHRDSLHIQRTLAAGPDFGVAAEQHNLSLALDQLGQQAEATELLAESLAIADQTIGEAHPLTATMRSNLAIRLHTSGDLEGGEALYRQALEVKERTLGPDHPKLTDSLSSLGRLLMDKGDFEAASPVVERAAEIAEAEIELARLLFETGRLAEASSYLESAVPVLVKSLPEDDRRMDMGRQLVLRVADKMAS